MNTKPHNKPIKKVKRNYTITSQTDFHLRTLAESENMTEGQIVDMLMKFYLIHQPRRK